MVVSSRWATNSPLNWSTVCHTSSISLCDLRLRSCNSVTMLCKAFCSEQAVELSDCMTMVLSSRWATNSPLNRSTVSHTSSISLCDFRLRSCNSVTILCKACFSEQAAELSDCMAMVLSSRSTHNSLCNWSTVNHTSSISLCDFRLTSCNSVTMVCKACFSEQAAKLSDCRTMVLSSRSEHNSPCKRSTI